MEALIVVGLILAWVIGVSISIRYLKTHPEPKDTPWLEVLNDRLDELDKGE